MSHQESSFHRCPHDKENPYAQISRELIRDKSISPECRWLLIYLLSHKDPFVIHMREVINHLKGMVGREKVYKIVNEAIEAGYILRENIPDGNLRRIKYIISETPKFKKCFPRSGFQEVENPHPENHHHKEEASSKEKQVKDSLVEDPGGPSHPAPSGEGTKLPPESLEIEKELLDRVLAIHPKFKKPKVGLWAKDLDLMNRMDGRTWEEIRAVIAFAFEDSFWFKTLQSGKGLRKHYDKIAVKMAPAENKGTWINRNRGLAHDCKLDVKHMDIYKFFYITDKEIVNLETNKALSFNTDPKIFEIEMLKLFKLRKKNE